MLTENIEKYCLDWTGQFRGGTVVCLPNNSEQVSKILEFCNSNRIGVVTQGGNTGLVGGSVGCKNRGDQLILSMQRLNKIIKLDENSGVLVCESGCILDELNSFVNERGLMIPLDLGSKGSCMIGGNVSTNAGGLRVLRYGSMHQNVLGIEVVLPNGEVLDLLTELQKDNTGYSIKDLFIGLFYPITLYHLIHAYCNTLQ